MDDKEDVEESEGGGVTGNGRRALAVTDLQRNISLPCIGAREGLVYLYNDPKEFSICR